MKNLTIGAALAAVVWCGNVGAAVTVGGPAGGLWAHQGDGGRGFNIDIQGDTMIVTTFVFTQTGEPIWYLSSGTYDHKTGLFRSSYDSYSNGQCFGCPPNQPMVHSAAAGQMSIQFHDNQSATLTTPSGPLQITKFNYGFASPTAVLYGEWALSLNVLGLVSGDWLVFDHPYTATDGTVYAAGHTDDSLNHVALGTYVSSVAGWIVVVQSSGDFLHTYQLNMDDHRAIGGGWVLHSNQTPTGNGSPTFGARILYKSELVGLTANPAASSSTASMDQNLLRVDAKDKSATMGASDIDKAKDALAEYASRQ